MQSVAEPVCLPRSSFCRSTPSHCTHCGELHPKMLCFLCPSSCHTEWVFLYCILYCALDHKAHVLPTPCFLDSFPHVLTMCRCYCPELWPYSAPQLTAALLPVSLKLPRSPLLAQGISGSCLFLWETSNPSRVTCRRCDAQFCNQSIHSFFCFVILPKQ